MQHRSNKQVTHDLIKWQSLFDRPNGELVFITRMSAYPFNSSNANSSEISGTSNKLIKKHLVEFQVSVRTLPMEEEEMQMTHHLSCCISFKKQIDSPANL